jgi:hypothetical protein
LALAGSLCPPRRRFPVLQTFLGRVAAGSRPVTPRCGSPSRLQRPRRPPDVWGGALSGLGPFVAFGRLCVWRLGGWRARAGGRRPRAAPLGEWVWGCFGRGKGVSAPGRPLGPRLGSLQEARRLSGWAAPPSPGFSRWGPRRLRVMRPRIGQEKKRSGGKRSLRPSGG